ncbi:MAG: arylsulfatase [Rikenellaceae bacterium]
MTRRNIIPAVALLSLLPVANSVEAATTKGKGKSARPNVVFIMTDDQGYPDLACFGNPHIKTPNMDSLYATSVRLTDYHVSPTSAPSRAAIMTGRYSDRIGVWHTVMGRSIPWEDEVILPEVLSANGYTCGVFGKWHLGESYPYRPNDRGFDRSVIIGGGGISQGPDYWGNDYFDDHYKTDGEWVQYEGYCTDVFFDEAIKFIEKSQEGDKPFFCYIPTNAPHSPQNVPVEYYEMYANQGLSQGDMKFYGMVTNIDDNIAKFRKRLDELGLIDNTIFIFTTDNGTTRPSFNQSKADRESTFTGFLREQKDSPYEGGHKVPFFISYPDGGLDSPRDINTLTSHVDLFPTFIEYLGLTKKLPKKLFDGVSIVPLLEGREVDWADRTLIVDSQREHKITKWRKTAVMSGSWRLINGVELYDLSSDPQQKTDIAAQHTDVVAKLTRDYEEFWDEIYVQDNVNERFAYNYAGGEQNPVTIFAHDLYSEKQIFHDQIHPRRSATGEGVYKIELLKSGKYKFSIYRYAPESGYSFNSVVPATPLVEGGIIKQKPAGVAKEFSKATISIGDCEGSVDVDMSAKCMEFVFDLKKGRYDVDARLIGANGSIHPAYYLVIERL